MYLSYEEWIVLADKLGSVMLGLEQGTNAIYNIDNRKENKKKLVQMWWALTMVHCLIHAKQTDMMPQVIENFNFLLNQSGHKLILVDVTQLKRQENKKYGQSKGEEPDSKDTRKREGQLSLAERVMQQMRIPDPYSGRKRNRTKV